MCEMADMMEKMEMMRNEIKSLRQQVNAVAKYLKMDFKYIPEFYEMVKPEELAKEGMIPMSVR